MTLTHEDLNALKAPFAANEHEFLQGNAYIQEQSITDRIESIDPAWSFEIRHINVRDNAGEGSKDIFTVAVHAALTIKGVTRENVGMATIQKSNPVKEMVWNDAQKRKVETGNTYTSEANEGEKSATTDALKRCARLFCIGRYLLTLPHDVKDVDSMAKWLKASPAQPNNPASGNTGQPNNVTTPDFAPPQNDNWEAQVFKATAFLYDHPNHQRNSINALLGNKVIKNTEKPVVSILQILFHNAGKKYGLSEVECKEIIGAQVEGTVADYMKSAGATYQTAWGVIVASQERVLPPTGTEGASQQTIEDSIPF